MPIARLERLAVGLRPQERRRIDDDRDRAAAEQRRRRDAHRRSRRRSSRRRSPASGPGRRRIPPRCASPAPHRGVHRVAVVAAEVGDHRDVGAHARGLPQGAARPAEALDLRRGGPGRGAHEALQLAGAPLRELERVLASTPSRRRAGRVLPEPGGYLRRHAREAGVHRRQVLRRPLVRVGDDPRLERRRRRPGLEARLREARHRVVADRRARAPARPRRLQPGRRAFAVPEVGGRSAPRPACRRRGAAPPVSTSRRSTAWPCWSTARRQERRDVGDGAGVADELRRRAAASAAARAASRRLGDRHGQDRIQWARPRRWPRVPRRAPGAGAGCRRRRLPRPGRPRRRPGRDRDRAQERAIARVRDGRARRRATARVAVRGRALGPDSLHGEAVGAEVHLDRAVLVRPEDPRTARAEPVERRPRRVAVRVAGAGRRDRDPRSDGVDECLGRRRRAAVVGDLEQVDARQPAGEQRRVDALLDVAHQQEPAAVRLAQEHDRDVVDPRAGVGRLERHGARVRPQDLTAGPRRGGSARRSRGGRAAVRRGGPRPRPPSPGPGPRMPGSYTRPTR